MTYELCEYIENEKSPFARWFNKLIPATAARIDKYLRRMEHGNMGDSKSVGAGVVELRINFGLGYRIYYGKDGTKLINIIEEDLQLSTSIETHWIRPKKRTARQIDVNLAYA